MKDGWERLDLKNQREQDRYRADKEASKNAKTSDEIAELCKDCKIKYYSPTGELLGDSE